MVCSAEAFNLVCPAFRRVDFFGPEFWDTQPWTFFFFQNLNCSLITLTFRPLAGFLLTISMSVQAIIAIDAPVSTLVIITHGRMPIITRRFSTSCTPWTRNFSSSGRSGLKTFRAFVVSPFPVGTQEDACSLPFRLHSLSTAGLRPDTRVFFAPTADVSRFLEACECTKLQESPFQQDPFAIH